MHQSGITATNTKKQAAKLPFVFMGSISSAPRQSSAYALAMCQLNQLIDARQLLKAAAVEPGASEARPVHAAAQNSPIPCGNYGDNLQASSVGAKK